MGRAILCYCISISVICILAVSHVSNYGILFFNSHVAFLLYNGLYSCTVVLLNIWGGEGNEKGQKTVTEIFFSLSSSLFLPFPCFSVSSSSLSILHFHSVKLLSTIFSSLIYWQASNPQWWLWGLCLLMGLKNKNKIFKLFGLVVLQNFYSVNQKRGKAWVERNWWSKARGYGWERGILLC